MKKMLILFGLMLAGLVYAGQSDPIDLVPLSDEYSGDIASIDPENFTVILAADSADDSTYGVFYTTPIKMYDYSGLMATIFCYKVQERDTGVVWSQVAGSGAHDLLAAGTYTGTQDTTIYLKILGEGTPDSFVVSLGDTVAGTDSFTVSSDTFTIDNADSAISIGLGKTVSFGDTDNHTADDVFALKCYTNGYASDYSGYAWSDSLPDSCSFLITPQAYLIEDSIVDFSTAVRVNDTGVAEFYLGKCQAFTGDDSIGQPLVRFKIHMVDSLSSGVQDSADQQWQYWFKGKAQRKR